MWGTVLLMAVVAGADPARIGAVAYILSRPSPMRLFVAYYVGGFGVSLIVGRLVMFVLGEADIGKSSSVPPEIEIAVGALALLVAVLVGTGIAARVRDRAQARHPGDHGGEKASTTAGGPVGVEKLPGFEKLPPRAQNALRSESPWIAWIAGVAVGMPTAYYLAAIAAILKSGVGTAGQVGALLAFNVVSFAVAEIPLVSYLISPDATRKRVDQLYKWVSTHQRVVITVLATIVGVHLLIVGISKL
ncbi:MAG: GAP family protein [Solirubrobacteraceae bacterium]